MKTLLIITAMLFSGNALADKTAAMLTGGAAGYLIGNMGSKGGSAASPREIQGIPFMCETNGGVYCGYEHSGKVSIINACNKYGNFKASGFVPVNENKIIIICIRRPPAPQE